MIPGNLVMSCGEADACVRPHLEKGDCAHGGCVGKSMLALVVHFPVSVPTRVSECEDLN